MTHARRAAVPGLPVLLAAGPLLALGACGGGDPVPASPPAPATFTLSEVPELQIGRSTGDGPYDLEQVSDATIQSDGSVAVLTCIAGELRYFDPEGQHIRSVGGHGRAPGQFFIPKRMFRLGDDTLGIVEYISPRITIMAPDGSLARVVTHDDFREAPQVFGRLASGHFVARSTERDATAPPNTLARGTASIVLLTPEGEVATSIDGLPAFDFLSPERDGRRARGVRMSRQPVFAVHPDRIYYGGQDQEGVIAFDSTLEQVGTIPTITRQEPLTEEAREADERMWDERAQWAYDGGGGTVSDNYAPVMPAFGDLVAGRDGRVWVEDPDRPWVHPLTWTAYEDGEAVARVELPPRFFPFEFGEDWVLGVSYDADGVETVEVRRFVAGPLPGVELPPRDAQPPGRMRCAGWSSR